MSGTQMCVCVSAAACRSPYPNDSELYNAIRERVKKEVFKGTEVKGAHRTGSEWAAAVILGYAATAYGLYTWDANPITGVLLGERLSSVQLVVLGAKQPA
jgi:fatty acid desaturase (delta-4 desaturase)